MTFNSSINSDVVKRGIDGVVVPGGKHRTLLSRMKRFKRGSGERMKLFKKSFRRKVFRVKYTNKLKGSYGETDFDKGAIKINRKLHKTKPLHKRKYPELADTIRHEKFHVEHPMAKEKTIRKMTRMWIKNASKRQKNSLYSLKRVKSK